MQDNGSWCGPSATRSANGILNSDWYRVGGGDGFYTANDPTDWTILYSESQDGATNRVDLRGRRSGSIRPAGPQAPGQRGNQAASESADPEQAQAPAAQFGGRAGNPNGNIVPPPPTGTNFRFYWNTPFILSPHNPTTVYLGGDRLFRSYNRGETWMASPDLTNNISRNDRPIMVGSLSLFALFVLSLGFNAARFQLAVQLQPARVFWMLDFLATIYVVWALMEAGDASARRARLVALTVCALTVTRGAYVALVAFPDRPMFAPGLTDNDWGRVMAVARSYEELEV